MEYEKDVIRRMTAILNLKKLRDGLDRISDSLLAATCDEAISALERENADGCAGCAFTSAEEWEMPCSRCKRNSKDYWRRASNTATDVPAAVHPVLVSEGCDHRGIELFSLSCPCCGYDFRNTEKKACPKCGTLIDFNKE